MNNTAYVLRNKSRFGVFISYRSLLHPKRIQNLMAHILVAASPAPGHVDPMLAVAQHLCSLGHSITFISGTLFHDQAAALGFRFAPLSGKADYRYMRVYEEFPEIGTAQLGSEALNATCIYTGIDPIPDQYRAVQQILTERLTDHTS
jgi:hypothetical protein